MGLFSESRKVISKKGLFSQSRVSTPSVITTPPVYWNKEKDEQPVDPTETQPVTPPTQFLYNGLPTQPTQPAAPPKRIGGPQYEPANSPPSKVRQTMMGNTQFIRGIANVALNLPQNLEKAAETVAYGINRGSPQKTDTYLAPPTSMTREQGVAKLKADLSKLKARPVPLADKKTQVDPVKTFEDFFGKPGTSAADKAMYGAGQFAGNIGMGVVGGVAPMVANAGGQTARDVQTAGGSKDDELANALIVSAVTAFGMGKLANSISRYVQNPALTQGVKNALVRLGGTGLEGGAVNVGQAAVTNLAAQSTYDPNRPIMTGKEALSQFASGAVGAGIFHAPGVAREVAGGVADAVGNASYQRKVVDSLGNQTVPIPEANISRYGPARDTLTNVQNVAPEPISYTLNKGKFTVPDQATNNFIPISKQTVTNMNANVEQPTVNVNPTRFEPTAKFRDLEANLPKTEEEWAGVGQDLFEAAKSGKVTPDLQRFANAHGTELSRSYLTWVQKNGLDVEMPEIFSKDNFKYDPIGEGKQLQTATEALARDHDGELYRIKGIDTEQPTTDDVNIAALLLEEKMNELRVTKNGSPEEAAIQADVEDLSQVLRRSGTALGQGVQAYAKLSRTPAGVIYLANKEFNFLQDRLPGETQKALDRDVQKVKEALKPVNDEVLDTLAKEMDTPTPVDNMVPPSKRKAQTPKAETPPEPVKSAKDVTFKDMVVKKIDDYLKVAPKAEADPVQDMVNELVRKAKETPIDDINANTPKRPPIQQAIQALESWGRYDQVYADARKMLAEKYNNDPAIMARLDAMFQDARKQPVSDVTLSSIIRNGMKDVNVTLKQVMGDKVSQKNLVNHILESSGVTDTNGSMRAFLMSEFNVMASKLKMTPATKQVDMFQSLYESMLKREFVNQQIGKVLPDYLTGTKPATQNKPSTKRSVADIVKDYYGSGRLEVKAITDAIVKDSGLTGQAAIDLGKRVTARITELRKDYSRKYIAKLLAERKIRTADPTALVGKLVELGNTGALYDQAVKKILAEKYGVPELTPKDMKYVMKAMDEYKNLTDPALKAKKYDEVLKYLGNKLPKSFWRKSRTLAKALMLALPPTQLSNVGGNFVNMGVQGVVDTVAHGLEVVSNTPKGERTQAFLTKADSGLVDTASQDFAAHELEFKAAGGKLDANTVGTLLKHADVFDGRAANIFTKAIFGLLEKGDVLFYKPAYIKQAAKLMKLRGETTVSPEIRQIALEKAQYNTFRQLNKWAQTINRAKQFGVVGAALDVRLPFVNTGFNMLTAAADLTPFGLIKAGYMGASRSRSNIMDTPMKYSQAQVTQSMARAVTGGIGLTSLGMLLQSLGYIDYDEQDGLTTTINGNQYTLDWIQPAAMSIAFGAAMQKSLEKKGFTGDGLYDAVIAGGDSLIRGSIAGDITDVWGRTYESKTESALQIPGEAADQYFSPLGALAKTIDPETRSTYTSPDAPMSKVQTYMKKQFAKTPFLSKLLPNKIDPLGNEMKNESGVGLMLLPGRMLVQAQGVIPQEIKKVGDQLKKTDPELYSKLVLKYAPMSWQKDNVQYNLTPTKYEDFAKKLGAERIKELTKLFSSSTYRNASPDKKAEDIAHEISDADKKVKDEYIKLLKAK